MLDIFTVRQWDEPIDHSVQQRAIDALEQGRILHFPMLAFSLLPSEQMFLSPYYADPHAKNISYHSKQDKLWGAQHLTNEQHTVLKAMLDRYARYTFHLVQHLFPRYIMHLITARTSFRPIQVSNRKTSYRKDDRRLHIDAFPSAPNQGKRILRVFCNVNPHHEDRIWRIGEPFVDVAQQFLPCLPYPIPGSALILRLLKITKSYRTPYDHYMLQIHDRMKADEHYQKHARQQEVHFAPGSTWIAQTDDVSHAAMEGRYVLEQTFYMPVAAMHDEAKSPLRILEHLLQQPLVSRD